MTNEQALEMLKKQVKQILDKEYTDGRIRGAEYAQVFAQLMDTIIKEAMQTELKEAQIAIAKKDRELKERQITLTEKQTQGFDRDMYYKAAKIAGETLQMSINAGNNKNDNLIKTLDTFLEKMTNVSVPIA